VERLNAAPVHAFRGSQCVEHLRLRRGCGEDHPDAVPLGEELAEPASGVRRRRGAHRRPIRVDVGDEAIVPQLGDGTGVIQDRHVLSGMNTTKKT
jgi:hypothetical protein